MTICIRIAHLFPELLNLYADQGNLAVLAKRAMSRDIEVSITPVKLGSNLDLAATDLIMLGGGSDREQAVVGKELLRYKADLQEAVDAGLPILAVCGGYQLLGSYYELPNKERIKGLSLLDFATNAGQGRLIGNIAIEWLQVDGSPTGKTIVGFENHGGRTHHGYPALGRVVQGHGNNGEDHLEGIQYKGIIATYIHGPLLPKNPHIADHLLQKALRYRGYFEPLSTLDDELALMAHNAMLKRLGVTMMMKEK